MRAHCPFVVVAMTFSPGSVHAASQGFLVRKAERNGAAPYGLQEQFLGEAALQGRMECQHIWFS